MVTLPKKKLWPHYRDFSIYWIRRCSHKYYFKNKSTFYPEGNLLPPKSIVRNLTSFLDDGILRVRGRLKHSNLSFDRKHPIILPQRHFFTELVIQNSHQATLHGGAHLTLAHTRYKFWIPNGRQAVRTILRKCITCFARYLASAVNWLATFERTPTYCW